jgi:hypothetical protein
MTFSKKRLAGCFFLFGICAMAQLSSADENSERQPLLATSAHDQDYLFTAEGLNRINLQAIREVNEHKADFSPAAWQQLAADYYGQSSASDPDLSLALRAEAINDRIHELLVQQYPKQILSDTKWVWNNVGGVYARIKILYCSMNEYIALFGSSLPQQGFSGEYSNMEVYDIMSAGEMKSFDSSSEKAYPITYLPGDISLLQRNETRYYNMSKYTYMIDYGRGKPWIIRSLWAGVFAPYFFVNHDTNSMSTQLTDCGKSVINHLAQKFKIR